MSRAASRAAPADDGFPIPPGQRPIAAMVIFLANLMVTLDTTVANVSVPHIASNLGATTDQGTWVITSYAVAEAICVPLSGWLIQRFGMVRVFMVSLAGFSLFSLLCGLSVTLPMLVACRIGQGLCGGPILPIAQTAVLRIFPPRQLPMAYAVWTLTVMLGPAFGPIIGGAMSDQVSWHWIFLINVPIGAFCMMIGLLTLRPIESEARKVPIDRVGMILLVIWISSLQLMLDTGRERDWFASTEIIALTVTAVVAFLAFIVWELTEEHPVVDVRLFGNRTFATCVAASSLCFGAYFSGLVTVPQWLQATMGYSATSAGMITALGAFASMLSAQLTLRLAPRLDPRVLVTMGCVWAAGSFIARTTWSTDADTFTLAWIFALQGFGMPMLLMPLTSMTMNSMSSDDVPTGAGLNNFVRTMSIAVATALILTTWNSAQVVSRAGLVEGLDPANVGATLGRAGLTDTAAAGYLSALVDRQAVTLAMIQTFYVGAIAMLVSAAAIWMVPRMDQTRFRGARGSADAH
ncbi:DHA2 family efflux MFS transporter permease subunit [Novosphingobium bradum]|uniref:DHA2 family efflux MFS transporter permease subunit n=1 Tax=Novosphingobium bradum TaxID=1737444 RepID=A0ABV7IVA2_9SPHN